MRLFYIPRVPLFGDHPYVTALQNDFKRERGPDCYPELSGYLAAHLSSTCRLVDELAAELRDCVERLEGRVRTTDDRIAVANAWCSLDRMPSAAELQKAIAEPAREETSCR